MPKNPIGRLSDFPEMIYCTPPELSGCGKWVIRGDVAIGVELIAEHENIFSALARFGGAYYKLKREAAALKSAKQIS